MSEIKNTENQTKKLLLQRIVDGCIIVLISVAFLSAYESNWTSVHASKENMFAISFDMFNTYYEIVFILLVFIVPNFLEFLIGRRLLYRYTDEKQLPTKLGRFLRIIIVAFIIVLCSVMFTDKYSRVEFYDNGNIIEYNRKNQVINEYDESNIDFIELRTDHSVGRNVTYRTEAVIHLKDKQFCLTEQNYIAPDVWHVNYQTERSLYGLTKIKENFPDKVKINPENIDTLLQVEYLYYTKNQAKELCCIFEIDYDETMIWLEEEWGIVLENDSE